MSAMIWVHFDALSMAHPVFAAAPDGARRIHVWDPEELARRDWSLKRCVFVLECLQQMDVELVPGDPADVLDADDVFLAASPDPYIRGVAERLSGHVRIVDDEPLSVVPDDTDMTRFFRFWNKTRRSALRLDEVSGG
ncbi:hypothetical protein [uncultured Algimonas sp.]|uniref:hypothetical protein n=1 Tax=uncultured Algimonas sp. TaxID=1547920 RepID=UPI00263471DD|nr:hypothetical protein [uncultured Algimonas sp.]